MHRKVFFIKIFVWTIFISLVGYVLVNNFTPFGITQKYDLETGKSITQLNPKDRVEAVGEGDKKVFRQMSDLIYFSTTMPFKYDTAKIKITYKNPSRDQDIYLGFQDRPQWHYFTKLLDSPILNDLNWQKVGENPTLFQREIKYKSYQEFLNNPPKDLVVGTYNFDNSVLQLQKLGGYNPSFEETVIDTPLRGKVVFYTYVEGEAFKLWVEKQDLNSYPEPDPTTIKIYKENDVVYTTTIEDDGIIDGSGKVLPPQEAYIQNPGPELPEPGVYKVVIDAGGDSIIKKIRTNLSKITFASPIFPVSNAQVYPRIVKETKPNKLISDALVLSATTYHPETTQSIQLNDQILNLKEEKVEQATFSAQEITEITVPKSDVVLKAYLGYFAFSPDQFFQPSIIKFIPITSREDIEATDFIISNYKPSTKMGEWQVAEVEFDLTNAHYKKDKLSWIIRASKLKENNGEIFIKNIEVTLQKKGKFSF